MSVRKLVRLTIHTLRGRERSGERFSWSVVVDVIAQFSPWGRFASPLGYLGRRFIVIEKAQTVNGFSSSVYLTLDSPWDHEKNLIKPSSSLDPARSS
jgi:hypothetical protein